MPFGSGTASSIGCQLLRDPGFQPERDDVSVPQLPHPAVGIPPSTCLFDALPQVYFGKVNAHGHLCVIDETRRWRVPVALRDDQLHGLEPLLALRIVAIPHADEAVSVLREQLLRAFLAGLEMQARPHGT